MAPRLMEMKRLLKSSGSIYLHCDPTMSHYLKLLLDEIFGRDNFRNEIVWFYKKWTNTSKHFQRNHDVLFVYGKSSHGVFNKQYGPPTKRQMELRKTGYNTGSRGGTKIVRIYDKNNPKVQEKLREGVWSDREIYFVDVPNGEPLPDVWPLSSINGQAKERTGYPTQKPLSLLERIIKASSNEGDTVFDPFCRCATTLVAADRLNRAWVGIDISDVAVELVKERIKIDQGLFNEIIPRSDIPKRTDLGKLPLYKSLANKKYLYGEQGGNCNGCQKHFEIVNFHVDHIIAQSQGGTDHIENLQLLCGHCNSVKGNRGMEYLNAKLGL